MPSKEVLQYEGLLPHGPNVPHGVRVGNLIEYSAVRPQKPDGSPTGSVSETPLQQARDTLDNLRLLLEREGLTYKNVVKVTVFCTSPEAIPGINEAWAEFFPKEHRPARVFVGVPFVARRDTYMTFDVTVRTDIEA